MVTVVAVVVLAVLDKTLVHRPVMAALVLNGQQEVVHTLVAVAAAQKMVVAVVVREGRVVSVAEAMVLREEHRQNPAKLTPVVVADLQDSGVQAMAARALLSSVTKCRGR